MRRIPGVYTKTMADYPDWQNFPTAQSDNLFPAANQVLPPGTYKTPVTPAVNWSSVTVLAHPVQGAGQVTIAHYADPAAAQPVGSDTWPVNSTTGLVVQTPLRARYVQVTLTVTSAGNMTAMTWAALASAAADRISFPVGRQTATDLGRALAANGAATYTLGQICAGPALFYFKPADAAGKLTVTIREVDELGNLVGPVADFGAPTSLVQQTIVIPDKIMRVTVTNTDAAGPHTYDLALTVPPC